MHLRRGLKEEVAEVGGGDEVFLSGDGVVSCGNVFPVDDEAEALDETGDRLEEVAVVEVGGASGDAAFLQGNSVEEVHGFAAEVALGVDHTS